MAMFSPWVALEVSTTPSGSSIWNSRAACSLIRYIRSAAAIPGAWPPRPGLARWVMAQAAARGTAPGFSSVVAALSR